MDTKPILLQKRELVPTVKKYKVEGETVEYCSESGKSIELLWLPVGHSELNPTELIWAQIKSEVAQKLWDLLEILCLVFASLLL